MKRFVVIGLGNFGSSAARFLTAKGHDVIAVDSNPNAVDRVAAHVTRAVVVDGTNEDMLERVGVKGSDAAIVSTGDDITASVLAILALRELNVPKIYCKVISHEHAKVMARLGVNETIFPEHESAENLAIRLVSQSSIFNFVPIGQGYSIREIRIPVSWVGNTLIDLQTRQRYRVNVVAIIDTVQSTVYAPPDPKMTLQSQCTLVLIGKDEDLDKLSMQ